MSYRARSRNNFFTDEEKTKRNNRIVEAIKDGATQMDLAKRFGISGSAINVIWKRYQFKQQVREDEKNKVRNNS